MNAAATTVLLFPEDGSRFHGCENEPVSFPGTALAASIDLRDELDVARFIVRCKKIGKHNDRLRRIGMGDCGECWLLLHLKDLRTSTFLNHPALGRVEAIAEAIVERNVEALVRVFADDSGRPYGNEHGVRGVEMLLGIDLRGTAAERAQALREWAARPVAATPAAFRNEEGFVMRDYSPRSSQAGSGGD